MESSPHVFLSSSTGNTTRWLSSADQIGNHLMLYVFGNRHGFGPGKRFIRYGMDVQEGDPPEPNPPPYEEEIQQHLDQQLTDGNFAPEPSRFQRRQQKAICRWRTSLVRENRVLGHRDRTVPCQDTSPRAVYRPRRPCTSQHPTHPPNPSQSAVRVEAPVRKAAWQTSAVQGSAVWTLRLSVTAFDVLPPPRGPALRV